MLNLGHVIEIDCALVKPFASQPRKRFNKQKMEELIASIRSSEQQTAIKVRELPKPYTPHQYELIDGERRLRACTELKIPVKAWVKVVKDSKKQYLESVISNFCTAEHDVLETYEAVIRVRDENGFTIKQVADVFGKSIAWVVNYISLSKLLPEIRELLVEDNFGLTHAIFVSQLPQEQQKEVTQAILDKGLRSAQVKNIVQAKLADSGKTTSYSPRKEREKFQNFLLRSRKDVEVLMMQKPQYYRDMFEKVGEFERRAVAIELKNLIADLNALQDTITRRSLSVASITTNA